MESSFLMLNCGVVKLNWCLPITLGHWIRQTAAA